MDFARADRALVLSGASGALQLGRSPQLRVRPAAGEVAFELLFEVVDQRDDGRMCLSRV